MWQSRFLILRRSINIALQYIPLMTFLQEIDIFKPEAPTYGFAISARGAESVQCKMNKPVQICPLPDISFCLPNCYLGLMQASQYKFTDGASALYTGIIKILPGVRWALVAGALLVMLSQPAVGQETTPVAAPVATPIAAPDIPPPPFKLEMPIDCTQGADCWIVNYVDVDPTSGVMDYNCGASSYDGHKGTDIAIVDAVSMRQGVEVFASAPGTVIGTRNDMQDIDISMIGGPEAVKGKECGNGVLLDHGDGWTTQYCHMMKGSIQVATGDKVELHQTLGFVGLSGLTQFPHIHLQVKYNDQIVDPFAGIGRTKKCGVGKKPLWPVSTLLSFLYQPTALYNSGFSSTTPNARIAREGLYGEEILLQQSPVIALWTDMFWVEPGDKVSFLITGPSGETMMSHTTTLKKKQARRFAYAGIRKAENPWPKGSYTGEIKLIRADADEEFSVVRVINVN